MFSLMQQKSGIDRLVILSGWAALLDTGIGIVINMALDHSRAFDNLFGISLLLGFPMFLLDLRLKRKFAYCLASLIVVRWAILSLGGPTPSIGNPAAWPTGFLLVTALVLLNGPNFVVLSRHRSAVEKSRHQGRPQKGK
jgi:hypothetical protein